MNKTTKTVFGAGLIFGFALLLFTQGAFPFSLLKQKYTQEHLGLSLEVPISWQVMYGERNATLILEPRGIGFDKESISILITFGLWKEMSSEERLEQDIERLKTVTLLQDVLFLRDPEYLVFNDQEVMISTIEMPTQDGSAEQITTQPMDIVFIDTSDRSLNVYVRKSNVNETLNKQADAIVKSIQILNQTGGEQ